MTADYVRRTGNRGRLLLALIGLATIPVNSAAAPPQSSQSDLADPVAVRLQSLLDDYVSSGKMAGIVVAIGRADAPATFVRAGSLADDQDAPKVTPDSLWRIYSMTKPITAAAAMILIEERKISIDQPVSDFIPAFKSVRVLRDGATTLKSSPAVHQITVRHLLTHSGGLTYQFLGTSAVHSEYQRLGLFGGRQIGPSEKLQPASLEDFANLAASVPLISEPGTKWNYSISSDILGRVIEVASKMPFDHFVQTRVLDPLNMKSTFWTVPRSESQRLASNYAWVENRRVIMDNRLESEWYDPPEIAYGGSGLVSSVRDYDRFMQMLAGYGRVGENRILKRKTVKRALSNLLPDGVRLAGSGAPDTARAEGFGAGGWVYLDDVPGGVRAGTYGWFGAAGTFTFLDPKTGVRVTAMANYFPADKWPVQNDIIKLLYSPDRLTPKK